MVKHYHEIIKFLFSFPQKSKNLKKTQYSSFSCYKLIDIHDPTLLHGNNNDIKIMKIQYPQIDDAVIEPRVLIHFS